MDVLGYGWPGPKGRWCTGVFKRDAIKNYLKSIPVYVEYIGIASDEAHRCKGKKYPLYEWEITEAQALQYCYDRGFTWDGLYQQFRRVSCWCCPLQPLNALYSLYINYPELWAELLEMDKTSSRSFKIDYTLAQLNRRFDQQSKQIALWEGFG